MLFFKIWIFTQNATLEIELKNLNELNKSCIQDNEEIQSKLDLSEKKNSLHNDKIQAIQKQWSITQVRSFLLFLIKIILNISKQTYKFTFKYTKKYLYQKFCIFKQELFFLTLNKCVFILYNSISVNKMSLKKWLFDIPTLFYKF